jgi:hypothetical protein
MDLRCTVGLVVASAVLAGGARAESPPPTPYAANGGLSLGYTLHRFQDDFGLGASVGSPTFGGDRLRVTLGGGVAWYPYGITAEGEQTWIDYGHLRLVFEGGLRAPGSPIRVYGFGGPVLYIAPDRLSSKAVSVGGIGGFGFEYYFMYNGPSGSPERDGPVSYFLELGGVGNGAKADRLPTKPSFGNGFLITVGLRWYL